MSGTNVPHKVQSLLIDNFNIAPQEFNWDVSLETMDSDFKVLSYVLFLEQLINKEFNIKVLLLEKINVAIHTPNEIVRIITSELSDIQIIR
jgi:hypothetical protein